MRTIIVKVFAVFNPINEQVIKRTVYHELQCTERVGYTFEKVALTMCEVIHRISLPFVSRAMVRSFYNPVNDRVTEVHVRVSHVNFCTEYHFPLLNFAAVHFLEQFKALFDRAIPIRAFHSRLGRCSLLCSNFFRSLLVYIRFSFLDEADGEIPQLLKIVGSIIFMSPLET